MPTLPRGTPPFVRRDSCYSLVLLVRVNELDLNKLVKIEEEIEALVAASSKWTYLIFSHYSS